MNKDIKRMCIRNNAIISGLMIVCSFLFTYVSGHFDVGFVGEAPAEVGFSSVNAFFYKFGYHKFFYSVSSVLGLTAFVVMAFFAFIGVYQLIKGKSLKKVDGEIYIMGGFYVLVLMVYAFFEKVIINYRPYIIDAEEGLEASYPSSHTMLAVCVFASAIVLFPKYIKSKNHVVILTLASIALMVLIVLCRLFSGVHWFTDIVGGLLISTTLFSIFTLVLSIFKYRNA